MNKLGAPSVLRERQSYMQVPSTVTASCYCVLVLSTVPWTEPATTTAEIDKTLPPDSMLDWCWYRHQHCQIKCQPVVLVPTSMSDHNPNWHSGLVHSRWMVCPTDISSRPYRLPNLWWYLTDCRRIELWHGGDDDNSTAILEVDSVVLNNITASFERWW